MNRRLLSTVLAALLPASTTGPIAAASVISVNGGGIQPLEIRIAGQPAEVVTGTVDFKALSKHFTKGMNRLGIRAGEATVEVLLEIEF